MCECVYVNWCVCLQLYEVLPQGVLTLDWFLGSTGVHVDLHVDVSGAFLLVALATELAAVGFLSTVRQQVFFQVVLGDKCLPAQVTAECSLLLVEADVCLQVTFGAEALVAQVAGERLLPGVG